MLLVIDLFSYLPYFHSIFPLFQFYIKYQTRTVQYLLITPSKYMMLFFNPCFVILKVIYNEKYCSCNNYPPIFYQEVWCKLYANFDFIFIESKERIVTVSLLLICWLSFLIQEFSNHCKTVLFISLPVCLSYLPKFLLMWIIYQAVR